MRLDNSKRAVISYIGLFLVAFLWGMAFTAVKSTLDYIPATYMVAIRFTLAGLCMCILFHKSLRKFNKTNALHGITIGIFLFFAYITQTIGCNYTTAGKNAFLTALYVIVVPFLHWFISKKRPELKLFIAAMICIIGIGFISLEGDMTFNNGEILSIICGILFGYQIAYVDKYSEYDDVLVLTISQALTCAVLGWIIAPFIDGKFNVDCLMNKEVWGGILYIALISTLICNVLQNLCQKYTKPENASLIMSTESVFGVLGSIIFLGEKPSLKMVFGCVLMMIAIILAQLKAKEK